MTEAEFDAGDTAKITELTAGDASMADAVSGVSVGDVYGIVTTSTSTHPSVARLIRIESVSGSGYNTQITVTIKVCGLTANGSFRIGRYPDLV